MTELLGQVGLIPYGKRLVSRAIEWVTKSDVHHVVICISETEVISADWGGAVIEPITKYTDAVWSRFPLTPKQARGCADWARAREGRPYNFVAFTVIGLELLTGLPVPKQLAEHISSDRRYECAQLADAALTLGAGFKVFHDGRPFGMVYPGSLQRIYQENGWWPLTRPIPADVPACEGGNRGS